VGLEDRLAMWTADAERQGYRVNGYFNPYLAEDEESPLYDLVLEGLAEGWFVKGADGEATRGWLVSGEPVSILTFDMTNPDAVAQFRSTFDWALDLGYSGWMQDFGEYVQPGDVAFDGTPGEAYHNRFPVLYDKAVHDYLESTEHAGDWLGFTRSGYTGAWQYAPMTWTGDPAASFEDADGLPSVVRAGINLGVVGVAFTGSDIGGFHCIADGYSGADGELWTRWIQQGAMTANMQDQNACVGAIGSGSKTSIWTSPDAKEAWRTYARLHTRLQPYFLALADEAHATGAPVMRHVFLEFPDRPDLADVDDAYLLGPAIYVAPVVERGAVTKTVELPAGDWLDWRDGSVVVGGSTVTLDAPLAEIPLLLRDGYLVPLLDPSIDTLADAAAGEAVDPDDVKDVYDVVGFFSSAGGATFALSESAGLEIVRSGAFAAPGGYTAVAEADLSTCSDCYVVQDLGNGVTRVRINTPEGAEGLPAAVTAGGLMLSTTAERRIRWDLYLRSS
jgi:alpha-glucosidase